MNAFRYCLVAALILGTCGFAAAEDWVGQRVMQIKPDVKFGENGDDGQKYFPLKGVCWKVLKEKDGWLRFRGDDGKEGWALKEDFTLLADAPGVYTDMIKSDEKNVWAWHSRGLAWDGKGELENAIKDFTEAIRLDPKEPTVFCSRGITWSHKGEYDKAIKDYDEAIRLDPQLAMAFYARGHARGAKKEYDKAINDYDESIRLEPQLAMAFYARGYVRSDKKEYDKAIKDYGEAIRLNSKDAGAFCNRGNAWRGKNEYDKAMEDYDEAIRLDSKHAAAFTNRGDAWLRKKEYDKAIKDCDEAIRLDSKFTVAFLNRGVTNLVARKRKGSADFRAALEIEGWKGTGAIYATILGNVSCRFENDEDAAKKFLANAEGKLDEVWPYPVVKYMRGDLDEAALMKLATDNDKRTKARCYLGLDLLLKGKAEKAREHFLWIKENGTTNFDEYMIALAELDRLDKAKDK